MKIKSIQKYEDDARIINVNFVTTMIQNSQVAIGMKYFVIEFYNKQKMGYDVGTALDEERLIKELCDCTSGVKPLEFKKLVDGIIKETPKFCYVFDNIWEYVMERKYNFQKTVTTVEDNLIRDINSYHCCKLYDLLAEIDRKRFEALNPVKEKNNRWDGKMYPTEEYSVLYKVLWDWLNAKTKGKYELVDDMLYNKSKKAEEKMTILKYKELSEADLAEVSKFVASQVDDKGWYNNTGSMEVKTNDGRKLQISEVDTLDLAIGIDFDVNVIGDYIFNPFTASIEKLFNGADMFNPVHSVHIDDYFRKALKKEDYDENRFYEYNTPYGRLGYDVSRISYDIRWRKTIGSTLFVTKVNEKSIQFITSNEQTINHIITDDEVEKRQLETEWKDRERYESFKFYQGTLKPSVWSKFSPEKLMEDARERAKEYFEEAVEKFGKPIDEQEVTEQELVAAASEAL